jgi:hypothetical protein
MTKIYKEGSQPPLNPSQGKKFIFGVSQTGEEISINFDEVPNSFVLLAGKSQTGKSTTLRSLINHFGQVESSGAQKTVFVLDFSQDLMVPGENTILIKGRESEWGINILRIRNKSEDSGGVRNHIEFVIDMFDRFYFENKMGVVQRNTLSRLLYDTYASKGIFEKNPESWSSASPTVDDLELILNSAITAVETSLTGSLSKRLEKASKRIKKIDATIAGIDAKLAAGKGGAADEKRVEKRANLTFEREQLHEELSHAMQEFVDYKLFGTTGGIKEELSDDAGLDMSFYGEKNVYNALKGLRVHIGSIVASGAFSAQLPPIKPGVNRFDLFNLSLPQQRMFAELMANEIFEVCKSQGVYRDRPNKVPGWKISTVLVVDEAALILPQGSNRERDDKKHTINRIAAEALKYSLSMCLASQRLGHFSNEQLANIHTKICLEVNSSEMADAKRAFGIEDYHFKKFKFGTGMIRFGSKPIKVVDFPHSRPDFFASTK